MKLAVLISGSGRTLKNLIDLAAEGQLPGDIRLVISSTSKAPTRYGRPAVIRSWRFRSPPP